ncbi:MAG: hypothetical protein PHT13_00170 [Methanosarcina sp.]|nr:hypothetical protein [Methanosarcina sp.]
MRELLRPARAQALELLDSIKKMIMGVFNKDVYGVYEGVIEVFDTTNYRADIRVIDLSDLMITGVPIVQPFYSPENYISVPLKVGTHVIIAFRAFKLRNPVVIGQIVTGPNGDASSIILQNGGAKVELTADGGIVLTGRSITANGEDLTVDDVT